MAGVKLDKFAITSRICSESIEQYVSHVRSLGASKIYLRDNSSTFIYSRFVEVCGKYGMQLFINQSFARQVNAGGIHLKSHEIHCAQNLKAQNLVLSCSAHNMSEILNAYNANVDFIMVSPVFFVENKLPPLGIDFLRQIPYHIKSKIYALGGINHSNIVQCENLGIAGIAGIRIFDL